MDDSKTARRLVDADFTILTWRHCRRVDARAHPVRDRLVVRLYGHVFLVPIHQATEEV